MQARRLYERIDELLLSSESGASGISAEIVESIDLIACSPLTRALQTTEIALVPHFRRGADSSQQQQKQQQQGVPIVALPLASERVYLISDLGTTTVELKDRFPTLILIVDVPPTAMAMATRTNGGGIVRYHHRAMKIMVASTILAVSTTTWNGDPSTKDKPTPASANRKWNSTNA